MDSTDPSTARRLRQIALSWLLPLVLGLVAVAATNVVVDLQGPPTSSPSVAGSRPDLPILSLRRSLEPLRHAAAERALVDDLDAFTASQPADTCLQISVDGLRYEHRATDPQAPASLQKLLTAVAVLSELGPEATFETKIFSAPVVDGSVPGNLYVQGSGDPILASPGYVERERNQPQIYSNVEALADAVAASGITRIEGSVVGDEFRYDRVRYNPALPSRFIAQGQVGPISALSVNDGFAYFPEANGVFGPAPDPAAYAATVVDRALRDRGVEIGGPPASGSTPSDLQITATHRSPPVSEIVVQMLGESDNNTAELLLKELGRQRAGEGSFGAGQAAVAATLDGVGIDVSGANVEDGSGLALENVVTCDLIDELLEHEPTARLIRGALAVAGETGTLARRWLDTDLVGQVEAKTGTLNQVTGLAGYARTADGGSARFAMIVNLDSGRIELDAIAAQQHLVEALVAHPQLPEVAHLGPSTPG